LPAPETPAHIYPGRAAILQRVLPQYRVEFFDRLAVLCQGGLSVYAGQPGAGEGIAVADGLSIAHYTRGINLHFGSVSSAWYLCWQRGLRAWLENLKPDVLIVEANPRYLSTPQAVHWMHSRGGAVIGWGLGAPRTADRTSVIDHQISVRRRSFYRQFDVMIAYSQKGAAEYRALGFDPGRIFVAPNAAVSRPAAAPAERPSHYAERPAVLFVGRLQGRKRIDILLKACAALPEKLQPRLIIVGEGPAKAELENLAASIYPDAEFTGTRHGTDLEPIYAAADVFVLPGTGGLAIQQAMAKGLPVIAAQGDGTQDDLVRPEAGWHVPSGDMVTLTQVLEEALSDPIRLRQMGQQAYRLVLDGFNIENMAAVFVEALNAFALHS